MSIRQASIPGSGEALPQPEPPDQRPTGADPQAPTAPPAHTNGSVAAPPGSISSQPELAYTPHPADQPTGQGHENGHRPKREKQKKEQLRVRRVRRVVRHVGLWSIFRLAAALYLSFLLVAVIASIGLWIVASMSGARGSVERFVSQTLLLKNFSFDSIQLLLAAIVIGVVLAVVAAGLTVVAASFYNLISDVVGGLEISVIEEEPQQPVRVS